jgi:cytochrome c oxidase assembly factor CtaG
VPIAAVEPWRLALEVEWMLAVVVAAIDYALVVRVFERRGDVVPMLRRASFGAGLAVILLALVSPVEHLALTSMLTFHLLQNVMLVDWAPPLLVLGLTPTMAAAVERHAAWRALTTPAVALALWVAAWYLLHLPPVYDYALRHSWALGLEHLAFLLAGVAFWWPVLQPGRLTAGGRVAYLFAAFVLSCPVALLIALAGSPVYDFYRHTEKLWGWSTMTDQQIGAIGMAVEGNVLLFVATAIAFARMLADEEDPRGVGATR